MKIKRIIRDDDIYEITYSPSKIEKFFGQQQLT